MYDFVAELALQGNTGRSAMATAWTTDAPADVHLSYTTRGEKAEPEEEGEDHDGSQGNGRRRRTQWRLNKGEYTCLNRSKQNISTTANSLP